MAILLSNVANKFCEGINKIKCKYGHQNKKCETCEITYKICDCFLECTNFKDDLIECTSVYVVTKTIHKSLTKS